MLLTRLFQRYALSALLALALALLTGCTDQMLTETQPINGDTANSSDTKLRYTHLVSGYDDPADATAPSKRILQRYEDLETDTHFIVGLEDTVLEPQRILQRYEDEGMRVTRSFDAAYSGFALDIGEVELADFLEIVRADDAVRWVEPDPAIQRDASSTTIDYADGQYLPWGVDMVEADKIMEELAGVLPPLNEAHVFVLDSGVDSPDLNVCDTRSFVSSESDEDGSESESDLIGHGTHLAGVIGAKNNEEGVLGIAPNVCLHDYRVVDEQGVAQLSSVVEAVDHITQLKQQNPDWPMVVNISLGADVGSTQYNALDEAIQTSIDAGVVYVLAAGNDGIDASTVTPARVEGAITVGAFDDKKKRSSYSNYGTLVDLHAPGHAIVSLPSVTRGGEHLAIMDGTSPAAAHVSGAAALYLATVNPSASTEEIATILRDMGKDLKGSVPDGTTRDRLHLNDLIGTLENLLDNTLSVSSGTISI